MQLQKQKMWFWVLSLLLFDVFSATSQLLSILLKSVGVAHVLCHTLDVSWVLKTHFYSAICYLPSEPIGHLLASNQVSLKPLFIK